VTAKPPNQVFIVGMNGSGTTMLLDHLSSHSMLYGFPNETRFLPYFIRHQERYGDLSLDRNYLKLWDDMRKSVVRRLGPGPQSIPIPEDWKTRPRSAASIFDQIMRMFAAAKGAQIWCEKTPMYVHHLTLLANAFPDAKFLHIVRDGRDCAASFHRRWKFNPVRTIYRWKQAVRSGRAQGKLLGSRYHEVRYESLTQAPEPAFREICGILGIPFEAAILSSARSRADKTRTNTQAVVPNVKTASQYFSAKQLGKVERVSGRFLTELGYACDDSTGDEDPSLYALRWWEFTDDLRRLSSLLLGQGRIFNRRRWFYVSRRVRSALKQKATSGL
jgi:hypothetical protein